MRGATMKCGAAVDLTLQDRARQDEIGGELRLRLVEAEVGLRLRLPLRLETRGYGFRMPTCMIGLRACPASAKSSSESID